MQSMPGTEVPTQQHAVQQHARQQSNALPLDEHKLQREHTHRGLAVSAMQQPQLREQGGMQPM
eukprot:CAMPEP_0206444982 /NCGR_PEP_ID=MMETSP0324_2-20121206/15223_1 /ASSEMBLY_ACC=CAM_ASM_000836 /TAXON_ID=2866 /ORGANISM="Crypthecodinium cohnii, Strain Seligo" /LENGTH=62 /DNA_ID=CAMNT_0053913083 /DNA_START=606 /DNA_END=794 /DNA_ORIENTATION=-